MHKYNITYEQAGEGKTINFKSKKNMIIHLNANKIFLNKQAKVYLNFNQVKISLKQSAWRT